MLSSHMFLGRPQSSTVAKNERTRSTSSWLSSLLDVRAISTDVISFTNGNEGLGVTANLDPD